MEVQTRSDENGLMSFETIAEAFNHAKEDRTVWRISFTLRGERFRFVRHAGDKWVNTQPPDVEEMVS